MKFDIATVKELSRLSKIEITEEEALSFEKDLQKIIGYFSLLSEVNTDDTDPLDHVLSLSSPLREDKAIENSELAHKILKEVPEKTGRIIRVPNVREGEG